MTFFRNISLFLCFLFSYIISFAQPANDDCSTAQLIISGPTCTKTNGDLTGVTVSNQPSSNAEEDVWYSFVANTTSHYITVTGGGNFQPGVELYSGACGATMTSKGKFTSTSTSLWTVYTGLTVGQTYRFKVYNNSSSILNDPKFTVCVEDFILNDDCTGAIELKSNESCNSTYARTLGATQSQAGCQGTADDDVWFKFQATNTTHYITVDPISFSTSGSPFDPVFQIFKGVCGGLTALQCMDAQNSGVIETFKQTGLTIGSWYYVRVYDANGTTSKEPYFNICITNPPVNDDCAGAISLTPGFTCLGEAGDGTYATQSLAATGGKGNANDDVWYQFKADTTVHFISVEASTDYDPVVQVFSACSATPTPLTPAFYDDNSFVKGSNSSAKITGLVKGTTYYYRVYDAAGTNPVTMNFNTCVTSLPKNDECAGALVVTPSTSCNSIDGDGTFATQSLTSTLGTPNDDVWFKFTAQKSTHFINVNASWEYDPVVEVFSGCSATPTAHTPAFKNDVDFPKASLGYKAVTGLTPGATYYYRIYDKANTNPSTMTFKTCVTNPPTNDDCGGATIVNTGNVCDPVLGKNLYATESVAKCTGNAGAANDDVWYKFTAQATSQFISVTPDDSKFDPVVELYSACSATPTKFAPAFCEDTKYPAGKFGAGLVSGLTVGSQYFYRVYDVNTTNQDTMSFSTCVVNATPNDECPGAIDIVPGQTCTSTIGDGTYATLSLKEVVGTANASNDDVWFSFTATKTTQFISVTPDDSKYDPVVQLFSNCPATTNVLFNDVNYPVGKFGTMPFTGLTIGTKYFYRVYDKNVTNQDTMTFKTCVVEPVNNNDCTGATVVTPGTSSTLIVSDGTYASESLAKCTGAVGAANDDVWFTFTATTTKEFISVTAPTGYDPVVEVYSACNTPIVPAFCEDAAFPKAGFGTKALTTVPGTTYYYRVYDIATSNTYPMVFTTSVTHAPVNDDCAGALTVSAGATCSSVAGDGTYASQSLAAVGGFGNANDDVWYTFTATNTTQNIYVSATTDYDPVVQVFTSNCSTTFPATPANSANDVRFPKNGDGSWSISGLTVGAKYFYRVYDQANTSTTPPASPLTFTTCVTTPPLPPVNDNPCSATLLTPSTTCLYTTYTNEAATATPGITVPSCKTTSGGDVWFKVKVPFSGELEFETKSGSVTDLGMAIYKGSCSNLTEVDCDYNGSANSGSMSKITFTGLTPGDTLRVRIWEIGNDNNGTFGLCVKKGVEPSLVSSCYNLDFENGLTGWFGTHGSSIAGASTDPSPSYKAITLNTTSVANEFDLMTGGVDPYGGFPRVFQGGKSLKLGWETTSNNGRSIEQYFSVTPKSNYFVYNYAVVLDNGYTHSQNIQPSFRVEFFDDDGKQIGCGDYLVVGAAKGKASTIGFKTSTKKDPGGYEVSYKPWTTIGVDLTNYIGKNVHARFTTTTCADQSHFGYVYLDCACAPFEVEKPEKVCVGDTARLYAPKGGLSYVWKDATGKIVGTKDSLTYKTSVAGKFKFTVDVTMFGTTMCESILNTEIEVGPTPTLLITNPSAVCQGSTVDITTLATTTGSSENLTYTYWKDNPPTVAITDQAALTTGGTYFIKGEKGPMCLDVKPVVVTINPLPTATIKGDTSLCKNATASDVTFTGANGTAPYTFTYTINGGGVKTIVSTGSIAKVSAPTTAAGTFVYNLISVKDASSTACNQAQTGTATVTVNDITNITIGCGTKTTNSVEFKWNNNASATSYTYSYTTDKGNSGNGTLVAGSINKVLNGFTLNEKVTFTLTPVGDPCSSASVGNCTTLNCNSPIVNPESAIVLCHNENQAAITYTSSPAGGKIKWTNGWIPSPKIGQIDSVTGVFPAFTTVNTGYAPILDTIFVTATDISCTGPALEHYITVNPVANVKPITGQTVCVGDNTDDIYFTTLNTGGTNTYTWTNNQTGIGLAASGTGDILGFVTTNTTSSPIIATITVTPHFTFAGKTCDGPTETFTITVNPLPVVDAGLPKSICKGESVTLTGSGAVSYSWNNSITDNIAFTPTTTNTYTVTGTDANSCVNTDNVVVTVNPLPTVTTAVNYAICNGTSTTLSGFGAVSYVWDNGITDNVAFTPVASKTYTVTGTDANSCVNTATVTVDVKLPPNVSAGKDIAVCIGSSVTLKGSGAQTYAWDNVVSDNLAFSPTATTTFTVTGTDAAGCTNTDQVIVTVNPLPTVSAGNDTTVCQGFDAIVKGFGALTYEWNNSVTDRTLFKANTTQTYTVTGTDVNGCENTDQMTITTNAAPTVNAGNDTAICSGFPAILKAVGNAVTFTWDNAIIDNVPFSPTLTKTYTLTGVDNIGCSKTDQVIVTVNALPLVNAGNDTSICIGKTALLKGSGAKTYVWDQGVNDKVAFSPLSTQTYEVTGTDLNGCINKDQVIVSVNQLPTVSAGNDTTVCQGFDAIVKGFGALTYEWNNSVTDRILFKANTTQTYIVTGTDVNGCKNTDQMTITTNAAPTVNAGNDTAICSGLPTILKAVGNAVTFTWDNAITDNVPFSPTLTKTYTLTGVDNIGCSKTDQVIVTVNALPLVNAGNDTSICIGKSALLKGSGAKTYVWDQGVNDKVAFSPLSTQTYEVTGTDLNGCINKDQVIVTINSLPTIFAGNDTAVCKGSSVTISGKGGLNYVWDNSVVNSTSFIPLTTKQYKVTGTDINGCINKDSLIITINDLPLITVKEVCETKKVNITANHASAIITPWTSSNVTIASIDALGEVTAIRGGQTTITFTDDKGCIDTKILTVNPNPTITNNPFEVCVKSKTTAKSDHSNASVSAWASSTSNATINSSTGEILGTSEGTSDITFTDAKGCVITKKITIHALPLVKFTSETSICIDDSVYMSDLSTPPSTKVVWEYGDGTRTSKYAHKYQQGGTYALTLVSTTPNGCVDSLTTNNYLEVIGKPKVLFTFSPDSIDIFFPEIYFSNHSDAKHYKWVFGDGLPTSVQTNPTHVFPDTPGQKYTVILTGYNTENGCDTSYSQIIPSKEALIYYIPNTFTPNGDEVNNTFKPVFFSGLDIFHYHLGIYNRWGELIFESNNAEYGWDGTYGSKLVGTGTYIWKLEFDEKLNGKRHTETGHVNVIK